MTRASSKLAFPIPNHLRDDDMTKKQSDVQIAWLATVTLALLVVGCGPPQAAPQNRQLITSLRTAISARNPQWLEKNAEVLEERRAAGNVSDDEYETFQAIIDEAKAGKWDDAEQEAIAFQKAQRPTREEIDRVSNSLR